MPRVGKGKGQGELGGNKHRKIERRGIKGQAAYLLMKSFYQQFFLCKLTPYCLRVNVARSTCQQLEKG